MFSVILKSLCFYDIRGGTNHKVRGSSGFTSITCRSINYSVGDEITGGLVKIERSRGQFPISD